ncbi:hypothetical protein LguiB_025902 [Lonicera macranthoides]
MSDQETEMEFPELEDSGLDPTAVNRLAMLRLNNPPTSTSAIDYHHPHTTTRIPCTMCSGSVKKRSPYSSSLHEPNAKRLTLNPPTSSDNHRLQGFSKISLPIPKSNPTLLRSSSVPVDYALDPQFSANNVPNSAHFLTPQTPENVNMGFMAANHPSPAILRRTLSDPTPAYEAATTSTPPRHPSSAGKSLNSQGRSPNAKRLKRMKDRMKEMKQWCEELIREDVEESGIEDEVQDASEIEPVEAAWVEKAGEASIIHFKCLCGKGYQILLYGNNCYYMLMPFEQESCETETEEMLSVERNGEWLYIFTQCPCTKGYMILLSGNECYYKLMSSLSS